MEFTERMEAGRDAAAARRHRGETTGKSAKGWDNVKRVDPARGTFEHAKQVALAYWDAARGEALESYLAAAYPERYELEF